MVIEGLKLLGEKELEAYSCSSYAYKGYVIDYAKVNAPINKKTRMPIYQLYIANQKNKVVFCIVDNSDGYQNDFSLPDMTYFDHMLMEADITHFYGATITSDKSYDKLAKLSVVTSNKLGLNTDLITTNKLDDAFDFIKDKIDQLSGGES